MKTVTVNVGGKTYLAAELTPAEFSEVARIASAMVSAARTRDLSKTTGVVRRLAEIICSSIRRAGGTIALEEIYDGEPSDDVATAIGILVDLTGEPQPPAGSGPSVN